MADLPDYITGPAAANGIDPDVFARFAHIESGGNPNARTGSYQGLFQLGPDEWRRYGSGNIYNATDNANAAARKMAAEGAQFQENYGRAPTPTDLYLIHQQGQAGYGAHMANPDAPAWQNMAATGEGLKKGSGWARQAIWGNIPDSYKRQFGNVDNVSSQDFINMWRNKVEGDDAPMTMAFADSNRGALSPAQDAINGALRGRTRMADTDQQPSLGASFLSGGPGALFGKPQENYDWGNSLQQAAAYAMALDTKGESLKALGPLLSEKNSNRTFAEQQKQISAVAQSYRDAGFPEHVANAAARSTTINSAMAGDVFSAAKPVDLGTNAFGEKKQGFLKNGIVYDTKGNQMLNLRDPGAALATSGKPQQDDLEASFNKVQAARDNGVTDPDELLKMMPPMLQDTIKARAEGRAMPSPRGGQGAAFSKNVVDAFTRSVYPDLDEQKIEARKKLISQWGTTATPSSLSSNAAGTSAVMEQANRAVEAFDKNGSPQGGVTPYNALVNNMGEKLQIRPDIATMRGAINGLAEAATRAARGNSGAERDIQRLLHNIDYNAGPQSFYNAIKEVVDYVGSISDERQRGIDTALEAFPKDQGKYRLISPEAEKSRGQFQQRYDHVFNGGPAPGAAPAAAAPLKGVTKSGITWSVE
jgi:Transglycosylase SLT domain